MHQSKKPNIVLVLADNLGWGELGCYGGGALRGAPTPRIDEIAQSGMKFLNFNVESDCVPTRSALMTGRHPIRTGAVQSVPAGLPQGIHPWERTLPQILKEAGYATGMFGKWHLGDRDGRYPHQRGFDEWYGPLRTYDECMWLEDPHYVPERDGYSHMHEGKKGKGCKPLLDEQLTMETKKTCDLEYLRRGTDFMTRAVSADKPFYLYFNHSLMHFPMSPRDEFKGKSTNGDWGDCLLMLDHDFGYLLDRLDELGVADNTIVVLCGDNGAEDHLAGRGTGGFFDGSYFSSAEGGIRTPLLIRWPGRVKTGVESNEMVHVTDMFTTLLSFAGCKTPDDRLIDGVDQSPFFFGDQQTSNREACMVWLKDELHAVKWKDFKINFRRQQHFHDPELPLGFARITHLQEDPKEREPVNQRYVRWWVMQHAQRAVRAFEDSTKVEELIPPGAPLDFVPKRTATGA